MTRLVVIGGNAAGMSAATKARRRKPDLEVVVLEQGPDISYSACGIPHLVAGAVARPSALLVLSEEDAAERGIEVRTGHEVKAINPYAKSVAFIDADGEKDDVSYDKLLIATGTRPRNPLPGGELEGVFTLRHVGDGVRLLQHLEGQDPQRAVVIGAGFVGVEMAEGLLRRGLKEVHLIVHRRHVMPLLDPDMTDGLVEWLGEQGVTVHPDAEAQAFDGHRGTLRHVVTDQEIEADIAVLAVGLDPATEFAVKAGLHATRDGYLLVDDQMRTNVHDVWAAGDCVAPRHIITGRPTPMPYALPANRMGRVAGESITDGRAFFPGVLGTAATRVFGLGFATTGLNEAHARDAGIDVTTALIESRTGAAYIPDSGDIAVKLLAETDTGRLVGCQVVGPGDAALRIDAAAVAIQSGLKAAKLAEMEFTYSPTLSPVWDPLLVAAQELTKKLRQ